MQVSVKVFLFLSMVMLTLFTIDHYYNDGNLGILLLLILGSLPAITLCTREERALKHSKVV